MTFEDTKDFAKRKIDGAEDKFDYIGVLISLIFADYVEAPKGVKGLIDDMINESRELALKLAKKFEEKE